MSAFYLDILKDRLYVYKRDSLERRSAQARSSDQYGPHEAHRPILAFTSEEIWDYMPVFLGKEESVHLAPMPAADPAFMDMSSRASEHSAASPGGLMKWRSRAGKR